MKWNADRIVAALVRGILERKCVVMVPRCSWTGHECDVLAITRDLRIIDVEVKISRADFKADAAKDKWWHRPPRWWELPAAAQRVHVDWPPKVWKHYVAMPREVWNGDALFDAMPSPASGLLLLDERDGSIRVECRRRATPNRKAERVKPAECIDIARLASLRMWEALDQQARANA